ncbi:MAG: hypothetical protein ACLP7P_20930 [Rhodomicrobium sp.]
MRTATGEHPAECNVIPRALAHEMTLQRIIVCCAAHAMTPPRAGAPATVPQ